MQKPGALNRLLRIAFVMALAVSFLFVAPSPGSAGEDGAAAEAAKKPKKKAASAPKDLRAMRKELAELQRVRDRAQRELKLREAALRDAEADRETLDSQLDEIKLNQREAKLSLQEEERRKKKLLRAKTGGLTQKERRAQADLLFRTRDRVERLKDAQKDLKAEEQRTRSSLKVAGARIRDLKGEVRNAERAVASFDRKIAQKTKTYQAAGGT